MFVFKFLCFVFSIAMWYRKTPFFFSFLSFQSKEKTWKKKSYHYCGGINTSLPPVWHETFRNHFLFDLWLAKNKRCIKFNPRNILSFFLCVSNFFFLGGSCFIKQDFHFSAYLPISSVICQKMAFSFTVHQTSRETFGCSPFLRWFVLFHLTPSSHRSFFFVCTRMCVCVCVKDKKNLSLVSSPLRTM